MTEPLKPYEPEPAPSYEYEYDYDDRKAGPRVLWGRVAALAVVLLLAFWLGRTTAGSDDEKVKQLQARVTSLENDNEDLQTQIEALQQPQVETSPTVEPTIEETTAPPVEGAEYIVQKGDTLRLIAQKKCGDPEAADLLAEVNDIADPTLISVGQVLTIPADCGA
jgi:nucleoid-associated protein YgaU